MGVTARIWDPSGSRLPVTIKYRIDVQQLWQEGLAWEEQVGPEQRAMWEENLIQMQKLRDFPMKRCLKPPNATTEAPQLHAFSDGGDQAFGTCIFVRWLTTTGVELRFIAAKAFVAPLKHKTTPRLELMGAVAMGRLMTEVETALPYDFSARAFWIDSEVVIHWVNSVSSRYKPFVSCRIQELQDTHTNLANEVRYVPSSENPADALTKPIPVEELESWHNGDSCKFLKLDEQFWPNKVEINVESLKPVLEEKPPVTKQQKKIKKFRGSPTLIHGHN